MLGLSFSICEVGVGLYLEGGLGWVVYREAPSTLVFGEVPWSLFFHICVVVVSTSFRGVSTLVRHGVSEAFV